MKSCAVTGISARWDHLGAHLKDKCEIVIPRRATFTASVSQLRPRTSGAHKRTPQSPQTVQLENRCESLHETEIEIGADKNGVQANGKGQERLAWESSNKNKHIVLLLFTSVLTQGEKF